MANVKISDLTAADHALNASQIEVNEAGTSKRVTVQQIRGIVAATADISGANQTSAAIPLASAATGAIYHFSWEGGDGTYTFALNTAEDIYMPDGTALSPGTALDGTEIAGHGDGHIEIYSDGTNWNAVSFYDDTPVADVGNWRQIKWIRKLYDFNFSAKITRTEDLTSPSVGLYTTAATLTDNWPITIISLEDSAVKTTGMTAVAPISRTGTAITTVQIAHQSYRGSSAAAVLCETAVGITIARWY